MAGNSVYKVGIVISADAAGVKPATAATREELASIGTAAVATTTKMQQLIATATGLHVGAANGNQRAWTGALAAEGLALDNLRAKYNPLFAVIQQYKAAQVEIRTAHAMGALSADEMTAALQRQRQAALASIDAIKGRNAALAHGNAASSMGGHNFAAMNAMFQLQDIGMTAAMGMNPAMIALQQGSQLAGNFAGMGLKQVGSTMVGAFARLLSPISLATVAVTGLTAAAIRYAMKSDDATEKANQALEEHGALIRRLRDAYGDAVIGAQEYARESKKILGQDTADSIKSYRDVLEKSAKSLLAGGDFSVLDRLMGSRPLIASDFEGKTYLLGQMQSAMEALTLSMAAGEPDVQSFVEKLIEIENHPAVPEKVKETAEELRKLASEGIEAQRALAKLLETQRNMDAGQRGYLIGSPKENARDTYLDDQRLSLDRMREEAAAQRASLLARSPAEKAAAARQEAGLDRSRSADEYNLRIELAGQRALAEAEKQLADAKRDRARSITETVEAQQLELSLIGKTISEAEALRMQYQLTAELKAEAAKNGVAVDQEELRLIEEKARAYGQLAERIAATNMIRDQQTQAGTLQAEIDLVGAGEAARRRALAALQAEQDLKRQGISTESELGRLYKRNAELLAEGTAALEKSTDAWNRYRSAGEGAIDTIFDGLSSGSSLKDIGKDLLKDFSGSFTELALKNPLKNMLFGANYGTLDDLLSGGKRGGGILSSIFGGDTVGAMTVNAATVMVNGGVTGGLGGLLGNLTGASAANSNGAAGNVSLFGKAIQSIESGGNYGALGPVTASGDRAYGAYQVMGANIPGWTKEALGQSLTPSQFLSSSSAQDAVFEKIFGGYVGKFGATGAAKAWFGGPGAVTGSGSATDMLGTSVEQYATKFNDAVARMSGAASNAGGSLGSLSSGLNTATGGLTTFGSGLGKFGQSLASALSSGNGGLASLLGSFTSYGISAFNGSPQFAAAVLSGTGGLWSSGGYTGPGGVDEPRGIVHAGEVVWSQLDVARAGGPAVVDAMRLGRRGYAAGGVVDVQPLPAAATGGSRRGGSNDNIMRVVSDVRISIDDDLRLQAIVDERAERAANRAATTVVGEYDGRVLPERIEQHQRNSRRR